MANLITKIDIIEFWPMSVNMDDARIDPYILRAEQNSFAAILSPELYFALKNATIVSGDRFDKLFNGDEYTNGSSYQIFFPGTRQLLCAYAFALISANNPVHVTRGGNNRKAGEQTENITPKETNDLSQQVYSEAIRLEGEFYRYMSEKQSVYPEFQNTQPGKNASFNFFNASRSARYGFNEVYAWDIPYPR